MSNGLLSVEYETRFKASLEEDGKGQASSKIQKVKVKTNEPYFKLSKFK